MWRKVYRVRVRLPKCKFFKNCYHFICINTARTCNTAMELEFCEISEFVRLQNFRPLIKSTDGSRWNPPYFVYAHMKSNLNFEAVCGPYGLQSLILVKYHSNIVLKWQFSTSVSFKANLLQNPRIFRLQPLASIEVWG